MEHEIHRLASHRTPQLRFDALEQFRAHHFLHRAADEPFAGLAIPALVGGVDELVAPVGVVVGDEDRHVVDDVAQLVLGGAHATLHRAVARDVFDHHQDAILTAVDDVGGVVHAHIAQHLRCVRCVMALIFEINCSAGQRSGEMGGNEAIDFVGQAFGNRAANEPVAWLVPDAFVFGIDQPIAQIGPDGTDQQRRRIDHGGKAGVGRGIEVGRGTQSHGLGFRRLSMELRQNTGHHSYSSRGVRSYYPGVPASEAIASRA